MSKRKPAAPPSGNGGLLPRWLIITVISVSILMWVGSIAYSATNPEWPVPASVHGAVIAVVSGVMGYAAVRRNGK